MTTPNGLTTSYVEWSAVIAGAVLACAVSLVLVQFGSGLGLTVMDTVRYDGDNRMWRIVAVGLWLLWVQLMASMAGGYLTGRMRAPMENALSHESEIRDGAHGLLVWATSSLAAVVAVTVAGFLTAFTAAHGVAPDATQAAALPDVYARKAGIILGFSVAASSIVSALAAWWMATVGGDHRDRRSDVSAYISFRRVG